MMHPNVVALPRTPLQVPDVALAGIDNRDALSSAERFADVRIEWRFVRGSLRLAEPGPEMLSGVVGLARVDDDRLAESVLAVARAFGPLSSAVCVLDARDWPDDRGRWESSDRPYGIRHAHVPAAAPEPEPARRSRLDYLMTCRPYAARFGPLELAPAGWEPVMLWRLHAARLAAILDVATALREGRIGDRRAWSTITGSDPRRRSTRDGRRYPTTPFPDPRDVDFGRQVMQGAVRDLFDVAAVRLVLGAEAAPVLSLTGDGLRAALAVQAALRISGVEGVAVCAECGAVVPDRTPDTRRAFCSIHRTPQIKNKWAARDARSRKKGDQR